VTFQDFGVTFRLKSGWRRPGAGRVGDEPNSNRIALDLRDGFGGTLPCVQLFPLRTTRNGGATCHILDIRTH
jgi:hypothetical protein